LVEFLEEKKQQEKKFLKKKSNKNQSSKKYNNKKLNDFIANNYTCFGCGKQGHIKVDFPNNESKEKGQCKKFENKSKHKRDCIV